MRSRVLVIGALLVAATGAVVALAKLHDGRRSGAPLERGAVSLLGDSLNVGIEPYLAQELDGWEIRADDAVGRPTSVGLERLGVDRAGLGRYVVVSLGTNDPVDSVGAFRLAVADVLRQAGSGRCVVWATVRRDGDAYDPFNEVLRTAAAGNGNLRLVEWAAMLKAHPEWLAGDGVHATPDGYRARASAVVTAMRSCPASAPGA